MTAAGSDPSSLYKGDQAIVDPSGRIAPGKLVLYWDAESSAHYFRKVQVAGQGRLRLVPLNEDHPSFETDAMSQSILAVVVGLHRAF